MDLRLADNHATPPTSSTYWVIPGRLLAGAYPGHLEPEKHQARIRSLLDAGIRKFVNLMEEDEKNSAGQPFVPYDDVVRQHCADATCCRYAIQDCGIPTPDLMTTILDAIDESLAADTPVYVHCWGGVGRTGTVIGCWLIRHQLADRRQVIATLAALRLHDKERGRRPSPEEATQTKFVTNWVR